MIGNVVGNYKITEKIGEGGMGAVFKGVDLMLEREVAIKVLRPELAGQPEILERFRSEAVTLAKLNHPKIATLYSFFRHRDDFLMVMEFVPGQTLGDVIEKHGALRWNDALPIFCQALEGIDHAHSLGIIHRDVKPANMMLTAAGVVKVMDFGIARVLGTARMTRAGHLIGTIEYMSPEQVKGQSTDARSDIYSAGIVLYELLTGRVPFSSNSEFDLMRSQIEEAPPPPRFFARTVPEPVELAILRALAKNPAERFETAGQFRMALIEAGLSSTSVLEPDARAQTNQRNSGAHVYQDTPRETRIAGSQEFPLRQPESHVKGTRIAASGETFSPGSNSGFSPSPLLQQNSFQPDSGIQTVGPLPLLSRLNYKHYLGAGLVVLLLAIATAGSAFMILRNKSGEAGMPKDTSNSIVPLKSNQPSQSNVGTAPRQGPAPNDAESMGIKVKPVDPTSEKGDGGNAGKDNSKETAKDTGKDTARESKESGGKQKRDTSRKAEKTDSGQRDRTDDEGARRSKALRALDQ